MHSISIPSSVEELGSGCFMECYDLEEVIFPADSKLTILPHHAFHGCGDLKRLHLPASLEVIGEACFLYCRSLSDLAFSPQGRLRELLHLPPRVSDAIAIPDSVEILGFSRDYTKRWTYWCTFGRDSKLTEMRTWHGIANRSLHAEGFLHLASRTLKVFRTRLEFQ
jgi:hypothetical protein